MSGERFSSWESAVRWLIDEPSQQALVRACYFDRPAEVAAERFWSSEEWEAVRSFLPSSRGYALDVGAGMGISSYALARDGWKTTALEPDPSFLVGACAIESLSKASGLPIQIERDYGEQLPFAHASFDVVHARQVLHHARDLETLCSEIFRVLKPGGTLVATREHVISGPSQLQSFLERHPLHSLYGGEHAFTLKAYLAALRGAGFKIKQVLGPLETVINYAPFTEESLCSALTERLAAFPLGEHISAVLLQPRWRSRSLRLLSRCDRRPGRLFSFVCYKD